MKTAEDWMDQLSVTPETALISASVNQMVIREIQLDAMKEGMRRAAAFADEGKRLEQNILTAAENLTEKDL